jgi:phosphate acyltransferase
MQEKIRAEPTTQNAPAMQLIVPTAKGKDFLTPLAPTVATTLADHSLPVKNSPPCIGIDLMGGDTSPQDLYSAVLQLQEEATFVVFASDEVATDNAIPAVKGCQVIHMSDDPLHAVRSKKKASLCQGINFLQENKIDAFVTVGNTGALLLAAKTTLNALPGIERPALLTLLPTRQKEVAVLDVGANVSLQPAHFLQFAKMGIAYQKCRGISNPVVGLLNIGSEAQKGTPQLREAYVQLESLNHDRMVFAGNIEGKDVFHGDINVLVTDGFTGNIFLKTAEGIAAFILDYLEETSKAVSSHLKHELSTLQSRLYQAASHGALLCGVDGIIVKCHGDATPAAFLQGIKGTIRLCRHDFLESLKSQL